MQIARWGNSLAVRLPADLVRRLGLKEGDQVDLQPGESGLTLTRHRRPEEILASLETFRGRLPAAARLSRDDANGR
ncbi:antitoxin MazE [Loktanella atrilutea]|uniref:Antitoxin MazE n=2 Tax=Loktanella atrilutea TaxID=366533 RepID=A0A1M5EWV7_LOKAT|nr:AbrB/MazE/SpoVT family DNA-binding domain-containing protein [Loktanella atrilutea]SHF83677.1 antitoxin MazE [Loktanella atrilutea]